MEPEQQTDVWGRIVARTWQDDAFKQRLLADPAAVLQEHGVRVPPGSKVKVIEDTAQVHHLTLPRKPDAAAELSEEELAQVVGGGVSVYQDPCAGGKSRAK
jgi:Nitrile hydratase, alpha chain